MQLSGSTKTTVSEKMLKPREDSKALKTARFFRPNEGKKPVFPVEFDN
jgi:hypothetical protein